MAGFIDPLLLFVSRMWTLLHEILVLSNSHIHTWRNLESTAHYILFLIGIMHARTLNVLKRPGVETITKTAITQNTCVVILAFCKYI